MSNFDFDFKDYTVRQYRIWVIIMGSWITFGICGLLARYGGIEDRNLSEVLVFAALMSFAILIFGFYASFSVWIEKKLFQYEKKINNDVS